MVGLNYVSQDMSQTVYLYKVNRTKTQTVNLYGETEDDSSIVYDEPIELNVVFKIDEAKNKTYDKTQGVARYLQVGNLTFNVYEKTLRDKNVDIINGDYIGVQVTEDQMEFFVVSNDGKVNFDNKHYMRGYKTFYRTINCVTADKNEFDGK